MTKSSKSIVWLIVLSLLFLWSAVLLAEECFEEIDYETKNFIVICENSVSVYGDLTEEEKGAGMDTYVLRIWNNRKIVAGEIKRHHEIELRRIEAQILASRLELQAPRIYVSAYGGGGRNQVSVDNRNVNTSRSRLTSQIDSNLTATQSSTVDSTSSSR